MRGYAFTIMTRLAKKIQSRTGHFHYSKQEICGHMPDIYST